MILLNANFINNKKSSFLLFRLTNHRVKNTFLEIFDFLLLIKYKYYEKIV